MSENHFEMGVTRNPRLSEPHIARGQAALIGMRIDDAIASFEEALAIDPESTAAHLGLYEALQVRGDRTGALEHQRRALARQRLFIEKEPADGAPTMLMLVVPGDWQANIPLEFMYSMMSIGVVKLFIDGEPPEPARLPRCDLVFNAVAYTDLAEPALVALEGWIPRLGLPLLNDPARVRKLSRDGVARDYADLAGALVPTVRRVTRDELASDPLAASLSSTNAITLRPVDSQAGYDLARIDSPQALKEYLDATPADELFLAPFIDYRSPDGFFRKYRVMFIDGRPFAHHLAISDRWMVHYYNARNHEHPWIRDEEARFLADVSSVFDGPRGAVLEEISRRVGLDYFGIDCGILPDGRVLIFEIDVAMIVHLGDPVELYPYKHDYVPRIYDALERLIYARAGRQLFKA